jgi:UDP-N-acetylmuramyl pentapeptide phosphotransferase/UDP-N-acetylglucosamine-1-phosphate transferase
MRWSEPALLAGLAVVAGALSAAGTAIAIRHAHRRGMLDQPGERRSHASATPRGGGIGFVSVALLAFVVLGSWQRQPGWWWIGGGLSLVAGIGWWDDHRPLPALPRLLVHALAALALAAGLAQLGAPNGIAVLGFVLALGLVNAWNFMDGIDGLAASQALLCAAGFACLLAGPWQALAVLLAGACLGFLAFNLPPARIFMGDVGSGALGYLVAALLAACCIGRPPTGWPLLLLPPAAMLVDSSLTLARRALRGEAWWRPHVQHLYQRLAAKWGKHGRVTAAYAACTVVTSGAMLVLDGTPGAWGVPGACAIIALLGVLWFFFTAAAQR